MLNKIFKSRRSKAKLFNYIDCWLPRSKNKIIIVVKGTATFSGNLLVAAMAISEQKKYKMFIYKDGKFGNSERSLLDNAGFRVLSGFNVLSIWHLLTAKLFVLGHAPRDAHISKPCKKRVVINLWHGVIFKKIELLMSPMPEEKHKQIIQNSLIYSLLFASSIADKKSMEKAFGVPSHKVKVLGQPRYQILKNEFSISDLFGKQIENIKKIKKNKKLILYAPTFREESASPLIQITSDEWGYLNALCEGEEIVIGIRPHPYDSVPKDFMSLYDNIEVIDHNICSETNLLLRFTDLLIVDYSSIWIDYLLLDRPIVGFSKDFEKYLSCERGFAYEFSEFFPAPFCVTIHELWLNIMSFIQGGARYDYSKALALFHKHELSTDFKELFISEVRLKMRINNE